MPPIIIFATTNDNKVAELRAILGNSYDIRNLADMGIKDDIDEPFDTFAANAAHKAKWVLDKYGHDCIAEDSGLCVDALGGAPGIYSARYSGAGDEANIDKLLLALNNEQQRSAHYTACIAYARADKIDTFEGKCMGSIAQRRMGSGGFGYDPIFIPQGYHETFGQLNPEIKKRISHRRKALDSFLEFLNQEK